MTISETLKDIRISNGWDIESFSKLIRAQPETITQWEENKSYPTHTQLMRISKLANIPADELLACDHDYSEKLANDRRKLQWKGILFTLMLMSGVILVGASIFAFLATGEISWVTALIGLFLLADGSILAKQYFNHK